MRRKKSAFFIFIFAIACFFAHPAFAAPAEPVSLEQFIDLVVTNNRTLQAQEQSVQAAYYTVRASVAYQRTDLSAMLDGTYISSEETLGVKKDNITAFDAGVTLNQGIDISGKYGLDEQQQILYYETQRASYESNLNSTIAVARETYYSAVYARDNVTLQNEILIQRTENFRVTSEMYKAGTAQKLDVLRADAQVIESESFIVQAETDFGNYLASMAEMAGVPDIMITDTKLDLPPIEYTADFDTAVARRPDIRAYRLAAERAKLVKKLNAKGLSPTLAAGVSWVPFADPWNFTTLQNGQVSVGLSLSIPIFDGSATKFNTLSAGKQLLAAESTLAAGYDATLSQLRVAKNNLEKAISVEKYMLRQMAATAEELRITRARYLEGVGDQLDLLNAFTSDQQSRTDHLSAVKDIHLALIEVRRAMGEYAPALDEIGTWQSAVKELK